MAKKISCFKIKNKKTNKIKKCDMKTINQLLDKGYTVAKVTEEGNKTKIMTYSPKTRSQAWVEHRKRYGNIPF